MKGKQASFLNLVAGGGWKGFTNETPSFKAKEIGSLREVYKDTNSALRKQLLIS